MEALSKQRSIDFMVVPEASDLKSALCGNSLWDTVASLLQGPSEVEFVKGVVGEDVIRRNKSASEELILLLDILADLREGHSSAASRHSPEKSNLFTSQGHFILQERVRQLLSLAQSSPDLFKTPRERQIIGIVTRPASARSSRSVDSRPTSASGSSSQNSEPVAGLHKLRGSLRFDKVQEVQQPLRACFAQEYQTIVEDIEFVRLTIDEEIAQRHSAEPTEQELRSMVKKLEDADARQKHVEMIQRLPQSKKNVLPALK
jgi:hypothetical protein